MRRWLCPFEACRSRLSCDDLGWSLLSFKSRRRTVGRSFGFLLLFSVAALWQLRPADFFSEASEPKRSHAVADGDMRRLRGITAKGNLVMVDGSHLRTVGCPSGDVCIIEGKEWMLIFYMFGVTYMFFGLAIVCDEFFVPALESFVDTFDISMDVAGATFMAAGGSMPELAISFIGTFQKTDVGFSTIVGSAVFNVLLVIGVCAIFSEEALPLTWWPLFRDVCYYLLTLTTLAIFFSGTSKGEIAWWEALILLFEYFGYCLCMKYNDQIQAFVTRQLAKAETAPMPDDGELPMQVADSLAVNPFFHKPSTFRRGIIEILTHNQDVAETAGIGAITKIKGNIQDTFDELDQDKSGYIEGDELAALLEKMGCKQDSKTVAQAMKNISRTGDGRISFEDFSKWYLGSEVRIEVMMRRIFNKFDLDNSGTIDRHEVVTMLRSMGHQLTELETENIIADIEQAQWSGYNGEPDGRPSVVSSSSKGRGDAIGKTVPDDTELSVVPVERSQTSSSKASQRSQTSSTSRSIKTADGNIRIDFQQFEAWYTKSLFWEQKLTQFHHEQAADEEAFTLDWPKDPRPRALFWYMFTYPICAALYTTMPDIRRPQRAMRPIQAAFLQFILSLMWIVLFSFCLVDWVTVCSNTVCLPVPVAAVTVLAAGTSIPDLLSSYIVAKQGEGDMAVSSSIGSNIFDICFGLSVPWLSFCIVHPGENVVVESKSIGFSVILLVVMLVAVVITIRLAKWRMTRSMGYAMLVLYVIFIVQYLLQELPQGDPAVPPANF